MTVQVLAAFGVDNTPVTDFGYKATGAGGAQTEVLSILGEPPPAPPAVAQPAAAKSPAPRRER